MKEDTLFRIIAVVVFCGIVLGMVWAAWHMKTAGPPVSRAKVITYNNFQFVNQKNFWNAKTGQAPIITNFWYTQWANGGKTYDLQFRYLPNETLDVAMQGQISPDFFNDTIHYLTFDPASSNLQNLTLAATDLGSHLHIVLNYNVTVACTQNATGCEYRPIVNCDANSTSPIFYLRYATPPAVVLKGNCITVQGEGSDIIRATERLLYVWYGIIPTD